MLRAASATLIPSLASARASAAEIPDPAPTISAVVNLTSVVVGNPPSVLMWQEC